MSTPTAARVVTPRPGNLPLLKASDVRSRWGFNFLLYGESGSGKTTLAAGAQDSEHGRDVLFIDAEAGSLSIADRDDIALLRPRTLKEVLGALDELARGAYPQFKTVVIDSLSHLQRMGQLEATQGQVGVMDQRTWGVVNELVMQIVRRAKGLTEWKDGKPGMNAVFTALAQEIEEGASVRIVPGLTPGLRKDVTAAVDTIGYLSVQPPKGGRVLQLEMTAKVVAKTRQGLHGHRRLPPKLEDPTMPELLRLMSEPPPTKS